MTGIDIPEGPHEDPEIHPCSAVPARGLPRVALPFRAFRRCAPAAATEGGPGGPLVFQRRVEPNEGAYSYLAPKGWSSKGGIFHVDPQKANGPVNSILPKNDLLLRRDPEGTAYFRFLPGWVYADLRSSPMAQTGMNPFPPAPGYQGMPCGTGRPGRGT
jgi:hypothetical protein